MAWFSIGFIAWIVDQNLCDYLTLFPYLHCFWHIFICLGKVITQNQGFVVSKDNVFYKNIFSGGYLSIVCCAYFYAEFDHPETEPRIGFWPFEGGKLELVGIPYVELKGTKKSR